jgi:hypothetical protein
MTMEFERKMRERNVIVRESKSGMVIALSLLASVAVYTAIARLIHFGMRLSMHQLQDLWQVFNIIALAVVVLVLAIRRTIYFSPRLANEHSTLQDLLRRWRQIDIALMALAEGVALLGLAITALGMPFRQTFHFFVAAFILIMVLMPIAWKVRDKLNNFENHAGKRPE